MLDAVVIGGGPAGATAALLLAQQGWNVSLIERSAFPRRKVCGEYLSSTNWPLLEQLGVLDEFQQLAGPEVTRVAIFAGNESVESDLPRYTRKQAVNGRALGRETLDVLLLDRARTAGVEVLQPVKCTSLVRHKDYVVVEGQHAETQENVQRTARLVISANGSWDAKPVGSDLVRMKPTPSDLLGFKAHFKNSQLSDELMPLLSFDGGYGGMVRCDKGLTSLSCCVRRDRLKQLDRSGGQVAGEATLVHLLKTCPILHSILDNAELDGPWLSAGPIRPGIRPRYRDRVFYVGNAAGEAHPVIAEGISMAMQSGWLVANALCENVPGDSADGISKSSSSRLANSVSSHWTSEQLAVIGRSYSKQWRRAFAPRLRFSRVLAHWTMRPSLVLATSRVLRWSPALLTMGARWSGKARLVVKSKLAGRSASNCDASSEPLINDDSDSNRINSSPAISR